MNRIVLTGVFLLYYVFMFCQTPIVIQTDLREKSPYADLRYTVTYDRFGSGFSRIEGNRLQYFSADLQKVWEKDLELVQGIGNMNWFVTNNNGEEMIIAQYGTAYKVDNIEAKLIKVDTNGNTKSIDLGAIFNFRGIGGYEFFDNGFMLHATEAKGTVTPYGNTLKFYTHILHFDYDLNLVGSIQTIPAFSSDEEFNYLWVYDGLDGENYRFVSTYYLKDGKPSETDKEFGQEKRTILISKEGKIEADAFTELSEVFDAGVNNMIYCPIKYDTSKYQVLLDGEELEAMRFFGCNKRFEKINVSKDGNTSENLVPQLYKYISPKTLERENYTPTIQFVDAIEDKVNHNLVLIATLASYYQYYVIILNDDLNIAQVTTYTSYETGVAGKFFEREFFLCTSEVKESYGQFPDGYQPSAFTAMNKTSKETMHTILDYGKYYLLITDDFSTKTTTVTRYEY